MSALGQKRTLKLFRLMSALPPKADISRRELNVRFVPKADIVKARLIASKIGADKSAGAGRRAAGGFPMRLPHGRATGAMRESCLAKPLASQPHPQPLLRQQNALHQQAMFPPIQPE